MNLLVDPGAELQSPAWVVTDSQEVASFSQIQAHTGTWSFLMRRLQLFVDGTPFWFSAQFTQSNIPLVLGDPQNLSAWIYTTIKSPQHGVRIEYDPGNGTFVASNFTNLTLGWTAVAIPTFNAVGAVGRIRLTTIGPLSAISTSYVDDVVWDWTSPIEAAMPRSKHLAYAAVLERIATLNGAPTFHTDLGGRVYPALFLPEEKPSVPLPFACFPLIDAFVLVEDENGLVQHDWEAAIHMFIADTASDPLQSQTSVLAAKAHDDLIKTFKLDPTLGDTVQGTTLLGGGTEAGALVDGRAYAELIFSLRITQIVGADVLGPE